MSQTPPQRTPIVTCPTCRGPARFAPDNPWRPFCSERCRLHDLGAWATEKYRVASPPPDDDDTETPPKPTDNA